ncbi:tRNA dimethylallyltransferase [Wolffia australiana]
MVERFFFHGGDGGGEERMMVLLGPSESGKTSLLFQFAFNCALRSREDVVFICNRRRIESKPPCLFQGIDPSSEVFRRIRMKYIEDDEAIKKYFAAFHLLTNFPAAVIIDDFGDFFDERRCQQRYRNHRGRDMAMVRTLSLASDAISHANSRLAEPCRLLLADNPRQQFIYNLWISCTFSITTASEEGDGSSSFVLTKSSGRKRAAVYSTALQYLVLQRVTEGEDEEDLRLTVKTDDGE